MFVIAEIGLTWLNIKRLFWKADPSGSLPLNFSSWTRSKRWRLWWVKTRTHGPPASWSARDWPAAVYAFRRRCLWTRCTCSGPSSSSRCCASFWRSAWTWWLCWVQPGSPRSTSPCLCGSPAPSPRLGTRTRRLSGAASPPSHLVGVRVCFCTFRFILRRFVVYNFLCSLWGCCHFVGEGNKHSRTTVDFKLLL